MEALVVKSTGSNYSVKLNNGLIVECKIRGKFRFNNIKSTNPIVVGDKVFVIKDNNDWIIDSLLERKNYIIRKSVNLSKQIHIIASNIDQAILMITIEDPVTTTNFIDRFLVSANAYNIDVVLLFNKLDIYSKESMIRYHDLSSIYENIGYECLGLSIVHDDLYKLKVLMKDKINVISGHSGVGKTSLINKLQPGLNLATNEISKQFKQGKHTTTYSQMFDLDFGSALIDTPGIKGFGLVEINNLELGNFFPEFLKFKQKCKYNDCMHLNEPGCQIKIALNKKLISESRYNSYLSMLKNDDYSYRVKKI